MNLSLEGLKSISLAEERGFMDLAPLYDEAFFV